MSVKESFKPSVHKKYLLFFAGIIWVSVGIMLTFMATRWLIAFGHEHTLLYAGTGFILSLIIHHFGFLRIVDKNLGRISRMEGQRCAFSFMSWKSYLIVAIMMTMGVLLRHSAIPKQYLAVLYIGIGVSLILSSIRYFRNLIHFIPEV